MEKFSLNYVEGNTSEVNGSKKTDYEDDYDDRPPPSSTYFRHHFIGYFFQWKEQKAFTFEPIAKEEITLTLDGPLSKEEFIQSLLEPPGLSFAPFMTVGVIDCLADYFLRSLETTIKWVVCIKTISEDIEIYHLSLPELERSPGIDSFEWLFSFRIYLWAKQQYHRKKIMVEVCYEDIDWIPSHWLSPGANFTPSLYSCDYQNDTVLNFEMLFSEKEYNRSFQNRKEYLNSFEDEDMHQGQQ